MAKRRSFKKRKVVKRRSYKKKRGSLKRTIRSVIRSTAEKKSIQAYTNQQWLTFYGGTNFATQNVFTLSPYAGGVNAMPIEQGVTSQERIGNEIKVTKLTIKGSMFPYGYDVVNNPIPCPHMVKFFLCYEKAYPTSIPAPNGTFFQFGENTAAPSNTLTDMWAPINTDTWRVLATKTFKLGHSVTTSTGASPGIQNLANNDYKMNCSFNWDVTKYCVKRMRWNDSSTAPTTRGVFIVALCAKADGGIPANVNTRPVLISYIKECKFTDL